MAARATTRVILLVGLLLLVVFVPFSRADGLCLFGCVDAKVNTKHFVEASKNLEKAAEGIAKFDPLGVKTLLAQNAALQVQLNSASAQLNGFTVGDPVVVLMGQLLRFRVAKASGTFRVTIWLESTNDSPIVDRHPILDQSFDIDLPSGDDAIAPTMNAVHQNPQLKDKRPEDLNVALSACRDFVNQQNGVAHQRFRDFLTNTRPVPVPANATIDLNQDLILLGRHDLLVQVTPVSPNAQGRWAFEGQIVISRPAAEDLLPMVFNFDSDDPQFANHAFGTPLPIQRLKFAVK